MHTILFMCLIVPLSRLCLNNLNMSSLVELEQLENQTSPTEVNLDVCSAKYIGLDDCLPYGMPHLA